MKKPRILVMLGDCTGIGPEVTAKAISDPEVRKKANFALLGDSRVWDLGCEIAGIHPQTAIFSEDQIDQAFSCTATGLPLIHRSGYCAGKERLGRITAEAGRAVGEDFIYALRQARHGKIDGIIYAPLHKAAMNDGGYKFRDELEFFIDELGFTGYACEINTIGTLWAARVASHVPIRLVPELCTYNRVLDTIRLTHQTLRDAGYQNPRIAMNSLNPHAGDNGLCGDEEIRIIRPAIETAQAEGICVSGPFPGDTVFLHAEKGELDAVIGIYHDQVQIGIKLLGFHRGVTINAGLPVILVTPAHGTAFDIAGTGTANPGPMKQAALICAKMAESRINRVP